MTTLNQMIDETLINLSGYTFLQDRSTWLTSPVTTTTSSVSAITTLGLAYTDNIGKGVIEVDEELMYCTTYDRNSATATIAPFGRGYLGTTGATHEVGAKVTFSPVFPRFSIRRAINDTIRAMGANLPIIGQTTFVFNPSVTTYELTDSNGNPLDVEQVHTMSWQDIGPSQEWIPVRRWTFDPKAETAVWGSGAQTVTIGDYITAGRTVKVNYLSKPNVMNNLTDVYDTTTGYSEATRDVAILGASYRLLTYLDPARAAQVSPQADEIDAKRPFGSGNNTARQIYALYQQRLKEEVATFQAQYQSRVHYSR